MIRASHLSMSGYNMTGSDMDIAWGTAVSIFPFGALIGALLSGWLADKYGRRLTLHVNNILAILAAGAMMSSYFPSPSGFYPLFHLGRLLIGINSGTHVTLPSFVQRQRIIFQASDPASHRSTSPSSAQFVFVEPSEVCLSSW